MTFQECPLCRENKLILLSQQNKRSIFKCINCYLIFSNTQNINPENPKQWCNQYLSEEKYLISRFQKRLKIIEKYASQGKILDIGCAAGFFLKLANKQGWETYGIDTCEKILKICHSENASSKIFLGSLNEVKFPESSFDVVVVFDTLEHISDISDFLWTLKGVIKPEGLLAISVPDQGGIISRISGKHWFDYKKSQHLYFFNLNSLQQILKRMGFKVIFRKKEVFYTCPSKSIFKKLRKNYPNIIINIITIFFEKLTKLFKINTIYFPLEHIYVIAKKEK